jgi:hypothetical protein
MAEWRGRKRAWNLGHAMGGIEALERRMLLSGDGLAALAGLDDPVQTLAVETIAGARQAGIVDDQGIHHQVRLLAGEGADLLEYTRLAPGGVWTEPQIIAAVSGPADAGPAIAVDQHGDVFVAWSQFAGAGADIHLSVRLHYSDTWSAPIAITDEGAAGAVNQVAGLSTTPFIAEFGRSGRTVHLAYESDAGDGQVVMLEREIIFVQPRAYADAPDLLFDQPVFGAVLATVPLVRIGDSAFKADYMALEPGRYLFRYLGGATNAIGEEAPPAASTDVLYVGGMEVLEAYVQQADANGDGRIDGDDYYELDRAFRRASAGLPADGVDLNGDGVVDAADYFVLDRAYLAIAAAGGDAEPAGAVIQLQQPFSLAVPMPASAPWPFLASASVIEDPESSVWE